MDHPFATSLWLHQIKLALSGTFGLARVIKARCRDLEVFAASLAQGVGAGAGVGGSDDDFGFVL